MKKSSKSTYLVYNIFRALLYQHKKERKKFSSPQYPAYLPTRFTNELNHRLTVTSLYPIFCAIPAIVYSLLKYTSVTAFILSCPLSESSVSLIALFNAYNHMDIAGLLFSNSLL